MLISHLLLAAFWIIFCSIHSILLASKVKKYPLAWLGKQAKFFRFYFVLFSAATFTPIVIYFLNMPTYQLFSANLFTNIAATIMVATGGIIMLICIRKYFYELSGVKAFFQETHSRQLIVTGIHKRVRHPLYIGTFILLLGLLLFFPYLSVLISVFIIIGYTIIAISFEEKKLEKEFGEPYRQYRSKVPMLIPKFFSQISQIHTNKQ